VRVVAAALVHYPVVDRYGDVVATAITNLDLHDIARSGRTFGVSAVYVVHPVAAQRELADRVQRHWTEGSGSRRIPDRAPAMQLLRVVSKLEDAMVCMGSCVELWTTSAKQAPLAVSFDVARERLREEGPPVLLVFGTGWGLAPEVVDQASVHLAPIVSTRADGYNHLSVRAAAAIVFDRLLSV
jgi:hypothetical protein